jgi:hypothetical protein
MNPHAQEFIPTSAILTLWEMPFFQQRLERFFLTKRIPGAQVKDLVLTRIFPEVKPTQKAKVIFQATYKKYNLIYEANRWDDPRFGIFRDT